MEYQRCPYITVVLNDLEIVAYRPEGAEQNLDSIIATITCPEDVMNSMACEGYRVIEIFRHYSEIREIVFELE